MESCTFPCALCLWCRRSYRVFLERVFAALTGADPDRLVDGRDEDLPVADPPSSRDAHDRLHDVTDDVIFDDDLDPDLRNEIDDVGRPTVDLFLSAGPTEALHLVDGHSLNADLAQTILHIVELERLDDGFDLFHLVSTLALQCFEAVSQQLNRRNPVPSSTIERVAGGWDPPRVPRSTDRQGADQLADIADAVRGQPRLQIAHDPARHVGIDEALRADLDRARAGQEELDGVGCI